MRIIISYDITDDRVRRQVVKVCEAYGQRVQRSVFECRLTAEQLVALQERLDVARKGTGMRAEDSIRIYLLCADCSTKVTILGYPPVTVTESKTAIIG